MKTYYIYNEETNEYIGQVRAYSIDTAEIKALKAFNLEIDVYALTTAPGETWA